MPKQKINKISKRYLIYLAGLIDSDGSIYVRLVYHRDYKPTRPYQISLTVQISQLTVRRDKCLKDAQRVIGAGTVRDRKPPKDLTLTVSPMGSFRL